MLYFNEEELCFDWYICVWNCNNYSVVLRLQLEMLLVVLEVEEEYLRSIAIEVQKSAAQACNEQQTSGDIQNPLTDNCIVLS